MKVLVPKRSFFGKILGSALLAMTLSVSTNAMSSDDSFDNLSIGFNNTNLDSEGDSCSDHESCSDDDGEFTSIVFENRAPVPSSAPCVSGQQQGQVQGITQCSGQQQTNTQEISCNEQILAKTQDIDQCTEKNECVGQKDVIEQNTKDIIVESKKAIIIEEKKDIIVEQKQEPILACKKVACVEEKKTCQATTIQQNTCNVQKTCETTCSYGANFTTMDQQASAQVFSELHWTNLTKRTPQKNIKGRSLNNIMLQSVNISNTDGTKAILNNVAMIGNFHDFDLNDATITNTTFSTPSMKISAKLSGLSITEKIKPVTVRKLTRVKDAKYLGFRNFEAKGAHIECSLFDNVFFQHRWKNQNTFENATIKNTRFLNNIFDGVSFKGVKFYNVCMKGTVYTKNANFEKAKYCTSDKDGDKCVPLTAFHLAKMGAIKTTESKIKNQTAL